MCIASSGQKRDKNVTLEVTRATHGSLEAVFPLVEPDGCKIVERTDIKYTSVSRIRGYIQVVFAMHDMKSIPMHNMDTLEHLVMIGATKCEQMDKLINFGVLRKG